MTSSMMTPTDLTEYMRRRLLEEREALRALDAGEIQFFRGNVDATDEAKALQRRIIDNYEKALDERPDK